LQEGRQEIQRGEAIVRGRAAAGDRSQYDVLRIELEARALDAEIATLEADRLDAAGRLGQLLGRPGWQPRARGDLTPSATAQSIGPLWVHAERNHPAIAAARHQVAAIHALLAQAERDRMPEVTLQVGLLATQAENSLSVLGGISLPLPLWNRQQGAIARAQASRTIAQQELRAVVSETQAALERTTLVSSTRHSAAARLAGEVFARLPELRRMAEDSYRQGKSGIVDLLDSFRSLKTLRLEYVDQIIAAEHAEVDLLYAAGVALVSKS
jgi:cobalt-zinc-cadmium efflux system outer membrane protein